MARSCCLCVLLLALTAVVGDERLRAADKDADLAAQLRELNATIVATDAETSKKLAQMLSTDVRSRVRAANERETKRWREVKDRAGWEKYRDPRLQALRASLGSFPEAPKTPKWTIVRQIDGDGYRILNLIIDSRPELGITANLYVPKEERKAMPGIIVVPSHHNPRTQGELQDMGMSWARLGCIVLVMENLGHGERRQHPFVNENSYPDNFRVGRQDYYFRYNTSLQLYTIGDSPMGWMAWDLMRGVDVLLAQPGVDKERILMLGSVAGGGDPAAVVGALDPRITAVGPFNFGGPQPETSLPLPMDAESAFNYAGGGSWESTRNLRLSARDGFAPWVIVGGVAPRRLMYAHEFAWDRERDPVWKRLQAIYDFYEVPDRLASANGKGSVTGKPPESTHCNNIGPEHRHAMYPALNKWFRLDGSVEKEFRTRHKPEELSCSTAEKLLKMKPMYEVAAKIGEERAEAARQRLAKLPLDVRRVQMQKDWAALLGNVDPKAAPKAMAQPTTKLGDVTVERIVLEVEPGIVVPTLLLIPTHKDASKLPVVVAFAQEGKQEFLKQRADGIAELLKGGSAVCLPDLRGTGETKPGDSRGRTSGATSISAAELMLGQTLLGSRLRDLRSVLRHLRDRSELDGSRIALWGDSFAPVNGEGVRLDVPWDAEKLPAQSEPLGELLALLGALHEPDVKAVYGQGGLVGYDSILLSHFCYFPHDAVVPGALTAGDILDVAAVLSPRPVRLEGLVDGLNRRVSENAVEERVATLRKAYRAFPETTTATAEVGKRTEVAKWLLAQLKLK
ncbi:MAG: acetylxylan esterase [Gemmataceae bacterium]|nr:acetylxylan esterase [Gemmataceae bacterium]